MLHRVNCPLESTIFPSGDNPNTTQTLEYAKDKYNVKIIK
jgi:hypothetical protein